MTTPRKIKIIIIHCLITIGLICGIVYLERLIDSIPEEEIQVIVERHEKLERMNRRMLSGESYTTSANLMEELAPIFKHVEEPVLIELAQTLTTPQIFLAAEFIKVLDPEEINYLATLFAHLNANSIKRLLYLVEKIGEDRASILIEHLLQLMPDQQKDLIDILVSIPLGDANQLIYLINQLNVQELQLLVQTVANSTTPKYVVELLLKIPKDKFLEFFRAFASLPKETIDTFTMLIKDLPLDDIINGVDLFIKMNEDYRIRLLSLIAKTNPSERQTVLRVFLNITNTHIERAIEMIEKDERLLHEGAALSERFERRLSKKGAYETLERSINTASRVSQDSRHRGLQILSGNVRDVSTRRILKQVDGQQDTYDDDTVEQLIIDFNNVNNPDKFINIISGSDGIIHGPYRPLSDREVSQERKLEVIERVYQGDLKDKKDRVLEFYDEKRYTVPQLKEDNFIILPPKELKEEDQL